MIVSISYKEITSYKLAIHIHIRAFIIQIRHKKLTDLSEWENNQWTGLKMQIIAPLQVKAVISFTDDLKNCKN